MVLLGHDVCVEGSVPGEVYELFVEEVGRSTVCIIDTDMDLNVKENSGCEDIGVVPEVELSMHLGVGERKVLKIQKGLKSSACKSASSLKMATGEKWLQATN